MSEEEKFIYTKEQAIEDGIIFEYDESKNKEYKGNCPECYMIGNFMELCNECNRPIIVYITNTPMKKHPINPELIAAAWKTKERMGTQYATTTPQDKVPLWVMKCYLTEFCLDPKVAKPLGYLVSGQYERFKKEQVELLRQLVSRSVLE